MAQSPLLASPPAVRGRRDGARRALHSQIERRRREKINDRLITLRNTVPACALLMAHRLGHKVPLVGPLADRYVAAPVPQPEGTVDDAPPPRSRRRGPPPPPPNYDEELGLHKLDVLTHTVEYIEELHAYIDTLLAQQAMLRSRPPPDQPPVAPGLKRTLSSSSTDETVSEPELPRPVPSAPTAPFEPVPVTAPLSRSAPLTPLWLPCSSSRSHSYSHSASTSGSSLGFHSDTWKGVGVGPPRFHERERDVGPKTSLGHYSLSSSSGSGRDMLRSGPPAHGASESEAVLNTPALLGGLTRPEPGGAASGSLTSVSDSTSPLAMVGGRDPFFRPGPLSPLSLPLPASRLPPLCLPPSSAHKPIPGGSFDLTRNERGVPTPRPSSAEDDAQLLLLLRTSPDALAPRRPSDSPPQMRLLSLGHDGPAPKRTRVGAK